MPINVTSTSTYLAALATRTQNAQTVSRKDAEGAAVDAGLAFPRWFIYGAQFRAGRAQYRVPTLAECERDGLGYPEKGRAAVASASSPTAPKASKPATSLNLAAKAKTVTPAPTPSAADMTALVHDDGANTSIQTAVSKALGVDVLLGASDSIPYVPQVTKSFVPWGHFEDLKTLVGSGHFLPVMVVGPSGNGKTEMCEQVCAALGREYVRVNITSQTDEDDLLGGFRLVNGETKFSLGPIPLAMLRGAVVNLDEVDLGGPALMCLQPVLEGKPLYLKKIGRYITPATGFTVVATANTKGRGDDGKYAHTTIMNEAMLERFAVMLEQGWADAATERKIVAAILKQYHKYDATLVKHMVEWAGVTRTNFDQQVCNDQIATRRLLHMARVFCALGSVDSALTHTLSRFDGDTQSAFKNLWNAIHEAPAATTNPSGPAVTPVEAEQPPF